MAPLRYVAWYVISDEPYVVTLAIVLIINSYCMRAVAERSGEHRASNAKSQVCHMRHCVGEVSHTTGRIPDAARDSALIKNFKQCAINPTL